MQLCCDTKAFDLKRDASFDSSYIITWLCSLLICLRMYFYVITLKNSKFFEILDFKSMQAELFSLTAAECWGLKGLLSGKEPTTSTLQRHSNELHPLLPWEPGQQPDATCSWACLSPVCSVSTLQNHKQDLKTAKMIQNRMKLRIMSCSSALCLQSH